MKQENRTPFTPGDYAFFIVLAFGIAGIVVGLVAFAHWLLAEFALI